MIFHKRQTAQFLCSRNIEMTPLCKVDMTLAGVEEPPGSAVPVVSMSQLKFSRLEVLLRVQCGLLRLADAAS
jgi:hypothetical protein